MILLNVAIAVFLLVTVFWLCLPFMRRSASVVSEADYSISVYRDQLDEIERERGEGLIGDDEAGAARLEIEARTLKAARQLDTVGNVARRAPLAAAATAMAIAAGGVGLYLALGNPSLPDQPLVARKAEVLQQRAAAGDVRAQVALLVEKTKENPKNFEDWWTLGRAYMMINNPTEAAGALKHAVELSDDNPGVLVAYAEAITVANGNKVNTAARIAFEQVRKSRPKDPRARYYLALAKAQSQDFQGALDDWMALKKDSAPEAPWMKLVRRDITNMARFLKVDLKTLLPDATEKELAKAGPASNGNAPAETESAETKPAETVDPKVRIAELEESLKTEPKDYKGWIELATLRAKAGENEKAKLAIENARVRYGAAPFILQKLDETARDLGLDHLADADPAVKGPDAETVAAAAEMSDEDRASMISGMVEGLAAKLEEKPDNPDGWIMLIRSYSVLKEEKRAAGALEKARTQFAGNKTILAALDKTAKELGIRAQ